MFFGRGGLIQVLSVPSCGHFTAMWQAMGGVERFDRRRRWWAARRQDFDAALR